MPEIKGFSGWRYNKNKVRSLAGVVAPPYDVISPAEQKALYRRSPYNVVRLILGRGGPGDTAADNKYTRAGRFLNEWISSGILVQEEAPAIYIYVQDYRDVGARFPRPKGGETPPLQTRVGFIAAMRLNDKSVLKHENTLAAPKRDRLALIKEVRANLSPVFGLFEDPGGEIQKILNKAIVGARLIAPLRPTVDITLDDVRHRLFVETRPSIVREICGWMRSKPMFIADGHHRFEVACRFRDWMRSKTQARLVRHRARRTNPSQSAADWNYVMTYFSDCRHNPLAIFPTHRLIKISKKALPPLTLLAKKGALVKRAGLRELLGHLHKKGKRPAREKRHEFGVYTKKEGFFVFRLNPNLTPAVGKNPVDRLDVAVLHRKVIEPCFGIRKIEKSHAIDFTRDARSACEKVRRGEFDLAFFLKATSLEDMIRVSKRGLKMPQKSTYFYPKLLSGLTFHRFENLTARD